MSVGKFYWHVYVVESCGCFYPPVRKAVLCFEFFTVSDISGVANNIRLKLEKKVFI